MSIPTPSLWMRVYIGEGYVSKGIPLFEEILWAAKNAGLGGATVIRGAMGLGHIGVVQEKDSQMNHDLPAIVEAVDSAEKINAFIPKVKSILGNHGLIITSEVNVVHQGEIHPVPRAPGVTNNG